MIRYSSTTKIITTFLIILSMIFVNVTSYAVKVNMSTSTTKSIKSYYTDPATCTCNLHASICDNFCCCDTTCSSSQILTWSSKNLCRSSSSNIQAYCDGLSQGGFYSFEDLACVYYSNRGNIDYFYSYPESGSVNYPTASKFVAQASSAVSIDISAADTSDYSASQYLLKMKKDGSLKYFEIWTPISGGNCGAGYVNITQSTSFTCQYTLNPTTCPLVSSLLSGTILICKNGDCSSTQSMPTLTNASNASPLCNNMITSQQLIITLSSSNSSYIITSVTATITTQPISYSGNNRYPIKTTITINKPTTQNSGNPGYKKGKPIIFQTSGAASNLYSISDSSGNCVASGTSSINVLFGQNVVYSCKNSSSSSLYIDSIIKQQNLTIQKWATGSNETISINGMNSSFNSSSYQTITLNILYTEAGWELDRQSYIISSSISYTASSQTSFNQRYFKINWIYVDYATISSVPTNRFYTYFEYMWKPLRDYFGVQ